MVLEIICFVLIARTNMLQGNDILNSSNAVSGLIYEKRENVAYYFGLRRMNDSLLNDNARLRAQLAMYGSVDTLKDLRVTKPFSEEDSIHVIQYASYIYRTARVVNNSVTAENNFITINRGAKEGIQKNMAVISGSGVVGRVVNVSDHFATVLSVLSIKQKISAKLKDGTVGSIVWEARDPDVLLLEDISPQIKAYKGDSVFTTTYSFFPPDVLIGTVYKKKVVKKNNLQILYLKSATNFRNLQYVYVVENKMLQEKIQLEDSTRQQR